MVESFSPSATDDSYVADKFAQAGSRVLFTANDGVDGPAVWSTDGTSAGTSLLAGVDPTGFATLGGSAYFLSSSQSTTTLWSSDGTSAGTAIVETIPDGPSAYGSLGPQLVTAGGKLFFVTSDGTTTGEDLWVSDGTSAGTSIARDFNDSGGSDGAANPNLANLTAAGAMLFFTANDGTDGDQLWASNGTSLGTVIVSDINPGESGGDPSDLTPVGSSVYFVAYDAADNVGLWVSNGTAAGTTAVEDNFPTETFPVADPYPGEPATQSVDPSITGLAAVGSTLYFSVAYVPAESTGSASDQFELWTSDGSSAGTRQVVAPAPGAAFEGLSALIPMGSFLLFVANDGTHGSELWRTDGTAAGTSMVKDISAGSASGISNYAFYDKPPVESNGMLYFAATDGTPGEEIWQTGGTAANTSLVADIDAGVSSAAAVPLCVLDGALLVFADDGTHGQELMSVSSRVAPVVSGVSSQAVTQGQTISLDLGTLASDASVPRQVLTYSLAAGAPAARSINPSTGVFTWIPSLDTPVATYAITAVASDGGSSPLRATQTFDVNVLYGGPPPSIVSTGLNTRKGLTITLDFSQPLAPDPPRTPAILSSSCLPKPGAASPR